MAHHLALACCLGLVAAQNTTANFTANLVASLRGCQAGKVHCADQSPGCSGFAQVRAVATWTAVLPTPLREASVFGIISSTWLSMALAVVPANRRGNAVATQSADPC
ncbi:unnamed protein product [Symbiodinium pilosum]|uniref:Uncharacterized protein n=1 Tax=Symbiodinium pilosum TaxID=2952 RepID=A0A812QTF7_SYMPI|nr:unnamed protein product [Symbiodinium pilosum]